MEQKNYILCMKWGTKYDARYVNRLYHMVRRHLSVPFTFICLTDRSEGIHPDVVCYPIPELNLPDGLPERGWKKLVTLGADLYGLQGTALFLDLDVVIIDNIDCFFRQPQTQADEMWIIRDWKRKWRMVGNSSVYRFNIGAFPVLLDYFRANFHDIRQRFRNEQAFLSWYVREYHRLSYWPENWCLSYKYNILKKLPFSLWQPPEKPTDGKIIIFHGEVNPPDAIVGGGGKWYRKVLPAPWLAEYWRDE